MRIPAYLSVTALNGHIQGTEFLDAAHYPTATFRSTDALGANAWTVIKRSEFNAGKYAPYVSDDVRIDIAVEAVKE